MKRSSKPLAWIELDSDLDGQHWWRVRARNKKILCVSEMYVTRGNAVRAAKRAGKLFGLEVRLA